MERTIDGRRHECAEQRRFGRRQPHRPSPPASKSHICFVAQAALSAKLLLSARDPAATTGTDDACAAGKGGLRKQGGDRPARRQKRVGLLSLLPWPVYAHGDAYP